MQTREYVQILLRNADIYRWLYASEPVAAEPAEEAAAETKAETRPAAKTGSQGQAGEEGGGGE